MATLHVGDMISSSTDSAVLTITSINAITGQVGFSVQHQYLDDGLALGNNTISDVSNIGVTVADDDAAHLVEHAGAVHTTADDRQRRSRRLNGSRLGHRAEA